MYVKSARRSALDFVVTVRREIVYFCTWIIIIGDERERGGVLCVLYFQLTIHRGNCSWIIVIGDES